MGTLAPKSDSSVKLVDGGAASRLGLGVFYEGLRFSRFSAVPFAAFAYVFSDSLRHGAGLVGFRTVLCASKVPYPAARTGARVRVGREAGKVVTSTRWSRGRCRRSGSSRSRP